MNTTFTYQNTAITFAKGDRDVMINATEMGKTFNKRPIDFLRNAQTEAYINKLAEVRNCTSTDLVKVIKGGSGEQGTWMHEDVAIEFARWISPEFAIWCNDKVKDLMRDGVATVNNDEATILRAMEILHTRLNQQQQQLAAAAPKIQYFETVLQSDSTFTATQVAKDVDLSASALNELLHHLQVQYKQNGQWLLYAKYVNRGLARTRTSTYTDHRGKQQSSHTLVWTEVGRRFIIELVNNHRMNTIRPSLPPHSNQLNFPIS